MMQVHFELPDDFAQLLQAKWHDSLAHYARERLVMESCRDGLLTKKEVGDLLGVDRFAVEALCKKYQISDYTPYTPVIRLIRRRILPVMGKPCGSLISEDIS